MFQTSLFFYKYNVCLLRKSNFEIHNNTMHDINIRMWKFSIHKLTKTHIIIKLFAQNTNNQVFWCAQQRVLSNEKCGNCAQKYFWSFFSLFFFHTLLLIFCFSSGSHLVNCKFLVFWWMPILLIKPTNIPNM